MRLLFLLVTLNPVLVSYCFMGYWPGTTDHANITYNALQNVLVLYFNKNPLPESKPVTANMPLVDIFANYYGRPVPVMDFLSAASTIYWSNVNTDSGQSTGYNADYHFDAERFSATNQRLIESRQNLVKVIQNHDFDSARTNLGQILHTIQDFYAHSNWVEMGNMQPNLAIGEAGQNIGNTATPDQQTCTNCDNGNTCQNNIVTSINSNGLLTSGYFYRKGAAEPESDNTGDQLYKPSGKCSHGGSLDASSSQFATGGINKDTPYPKYSPHYNLHNTASDLALQATINYLNDLWVTVGDNDFARLLNLKLSAALAIVIDTTGSMDPYIAAVKLRCQEIILAAAGSIFQPSEYILVPFNDPEYGPVYTTTDPNQMIAWINSLTAGGGGDIPEMCFHGVQLAEQASPYGTPIFVFTDAPPKDGDLFLDVLTLAIADDLTINFCGANLGDDAMSLKTVHQSNSNGAAFDVGSEEDVGTFQMYDELAAATGGYVLTTTSDTGNIFNSTAFIDSMLLSSTVNLIQLKNQSGSNVFNIPIDQTVGSFSIMLTSAYTLDVNFMLISPDGNVSEYSLLTDTTTTKYLQVVPVQPGAWTFSVSTTNPNYFISIQGQSVWDILLTLTQFDFISPHPSYQVITGNPIAMSNATLFITPASDKVKIIKLSVVDAASERFLFSVYPERNLNERCYMAEFFVPTKPFYFIVNGKDQLNNEAVRTSTQIFIPTTIELSANWIGNSTSSIQPGHYLQVSFNVTNLGTDNTFSIIVTDSLNLVTSYTPHSMALQTETSGEGFITLYANSSVAPGSVSILQVIAQVDGSELNNFLHMLIYVVPITYDIYPPKCIILNSNINASCPLTNAFCDNYNWNASMVFSDHGSGLYRTSTISYGANVTWDIESFPPFLQDTNVTAYASGDCCFENTTLIVVDGVGLTGSCVLTNHHIETTTPAKVTTQMPFDCTDKSNGNYMDPNHPCSHIYYACSNGYTYVMPCPSNLYYDQAQDECLGKADVPQCN